MDVWLHWIYMGALLGVVEFFLGTRIFLFLAGVAVSIGIGVWVV